MSTAWCERVVNPSLFIISYNSFTPSPRLSFSCISDISDAWRLRTSGDPHLQYTCNRSTRTSGIFQNVLCRASPFGRQIFLHLTKRCCSTEVSIIWKLLHRKEIIYFCSKEANTLHRLYYNISYILYPHLGKWKTRALHVTPCGASAHLLKTVSYIKYCLQNFALFLSNASCHDKQILIPFEMFE
jgi:hypothetical protein